MFDLSKLKIIPVELDREMKKSYIDYAMSVIVGRALPSVQDGLKPVHRRILYTMYESGLTPDKGYRKCATTVGDVLGKYHPHGDAAVYDSLVRMAQDFSLRYPLVDGHGNFGSIDGDSPAAYRYTEARMAKLAVEMLTDIEKDTVDFVPNYDERLKEPTVIPSRFPNLLVNGSSGIAVGMATNIPPHNLTEVIDGIIALIDNSELEIVDIMQYIQAPDFPTGAKIMGMSGVRAAYHTGRGKVIMRAVAEIEEWKENRQKIVVTEIPYMVNKARLLEKIAELVHDKRVEGISDLRDESDRDGMRIVIELKRDVNANIILNQLYKYTQLQDTFSIIMLALVNNEPKVLNLKEMLTHYIDFQKQIIVRRTVFDKKKAEARAHLLEGLRLALDHIDEIISIIRSSYNDAKQRLIDRFEFSDVQAQAILDMRLARLQGLEREKIDNEYNDLMELIKYLTSILESEQMVMDIIKEELTTIRDKFGDERRTSIEPVADEIDIEDLIEEEDMVITLTHFGYIKRLTTDTYRAQRRGGRGVAGLQTREEDFVETMFISSTHANILFFTNKGRVYTLKGYQIPEAGRTAKGTAIVNLLELDAGEKISAMIPVREFEEGKFLLMSTKNGVIKKTDLLEYAVTRRGGKNAIKLDDNDELITVNLTDGANDVFVCTYKGKLIRFNETDIRPLGRVSRGVRGIKLGMDDYVVDMNIIDANDTERNLLIVTENGYGKRTELVEYRPQGRGGMGNKTYRISPVTGNIVGMKVVSDNEDILLITNEGVIIRMTVESISTIGRVAKGVRLMRLAEDVKVVGIAAVPQEEEDVGEVMGDVVGDAHPGVPQEETQTEE